MQRLLMNDRRVSQLFIALACVACVVAALAATTRGIGLSPDSLQYLAASENASAGNGLTTFGWDGEPTPLRHFPPGYPLLLTVAQKVGATPQAFARLSNVVLFVLTILLAAVITRRIAPQSTWAPAVVAVGSALAHDLVVVHSMAWSEPLYLTLTLTGLLALAAAIDGRNVTLLAVAAVAAGLAALVRYIGVANIAVIGLALLLWWRGSFWRRTGVAAAASLGAALPLVIGIALSAGSGGGGGGGGGAVANREFGWYPLTAVDVRLGAAVVTKWVTPSNDASWATGVWFLLLVVLVALLITGRRLERNRTTAVESRTKMTRIVALYALTYLAVFVLAMSLMDAQTVFEPRHLTPVFLSALILGVGWLAREAAHAPLVRFTTAAIVVHLLLANALRLVPWLREANTHGLALRRVESDAAALLSVTRKLPDSARVYSNDPYFMRVHTERMVPGLPRARDPNSLLPNPRFNQQVQAICDSAASRPTFLILFDAPVSSDSTAQGDIAARSGEVELLPGGALVRVRPRCAAMAKTAPEPARRPNETRHL